MGYLREKFGQTEESAFAWSRHWIETGFEAYEATIAKDRKTGAFSHGDTADLRRSLPGAAGLQCRALQGRHGAISDHPAHLCHLHEASRLRRRPALQAAGRRTVRKSVIALAAVVVLAGAAVRRRAGDGAACRGQIKSEIERDGATKVDEVERGPVRPAHHASEPQIDGRAEELSVGRWEASGLAWPLGELLARPHAARRASAGAIRCGPTRVELENVRMVDRPPAAAGAWTRC